MLKDPDLLFMELELCVHLYVCEWFVHRHSIVRASSAIRFLLLHSILFVVVVVVVNSAPPDRPSLL